MSFSLHSIDNMIAAELRNGSTDTPAAPPLAQDAANGRRKAQSSNAIPPWKKSHGSRDGGSRQHGNTSGSFYGSYAARRGGYAKTHGHGGEVGQRHSHAGEAVSPSQASRQLQQLQQKYDNLRRKIVKDRAQANSTIAALRADKETSERTWTSKLEKLTKSRKRTESGLTTKISGLEQEIQKLRNQARTRAKRRKEQEKAWQDAIDTLRSENIRLTESSSESANHRQVWSMDLNKKHNCIESNECSVIYSRLLFFTAILFVQELSRLTDANRDLERRLDEATRQHREDLDDMLLRYSEVRVVVSILSVLLRFELGNLELS